MGGYGRGVGWSVTPVRPSFVLHYSEDASIEVFEPHVPTTNSTSVPLVWAIEPRYAPLYWFPRACPRVAVWANNLAQRAAVTARWGTTSDRVQFADRADEQWIRSTPLFEYTFDPDDFEAWPQAEGQWVATRAVRPRARRSLADAVDVQRSAGVDLRLVDNLDAVRIGVIESRLPFSIVRWAQRT